MNFAHKSLNSFNPLVLLRKIRSAVRVVYLYGVPAAVEYAKKGDAGPSNNSPKHRLHSLVRLEDVLSADWTLPRAWPGKPNPSPQSRHHVAWIMSPPGVSSGGHQNIYRFIDVLERQGHQCSIYLYGSEDNLPTEAEVRKLTNAADAYPNVKARVFHYAGEVAPDVDAIFATGWETAYPSFNDASQAKRFYFIQDYEPLFYALGTDSKLAENTYKFGFHGITAGGWLAHKVSTEFGMTADHFDFAVDPSRYYLTNKGNRDEVFFYARPVTPRRAFEFGVLVLKELLALRPGTVINFAGWDTSDWEVPFDYNNLGALALADLNDVYNRCGAALVLSLSNMSLLPLELAAAGVVPVVNDAPNNRMVSDSEVLAYEPLVPRIMAERLCAILDAPKSQAELRHMSDAVSDFTWEDSGAQFLAAFDRQMHG